MAEVLSITPLSPLCLCIPSAQAPGGGSLTALAPEWTKFSLTQYFDVIHNRNFSFNIYIHVGHSREERGETERYWRHLIHYIHLPSFYLRQLYQHLSIYYGKAHFAGNNCGNVYPQVFELIREKLIYFLHQIHNDNNTPATRNIKLI